MRALLTVALLGCGVSAQEHARTVQERDSLAAALAASRTELDELKYGAARLLASAKAAFAADSMENVRALTGELLARHPSAPEALEAKGLAARAQEVLDARAAAAAAQANATKRAEEARLAAALANVYKRRDDVRSVTFYYARGTSNFVNDRSQVLLYIVQPDDGSPMLRFSVRYVADEWLFIQAYTFKVDGRTYDIDASGLSDVERDNGYGGIWEWYDVLAGSDETDIAEAIADSKQALVRYRGRQYYHDRTIGADEKRAIRRVLDAYEVLKAKSS